MKKTMIILLSVCVVLFLAGGGMYAAAVAMGADGYTAEVGGVTISATPGGFHFYLGEDERTSAPAAPSAPDSPTQNSPAPDDSLVRVEAELHLYDLEVTTGRELNIWTEDEGRGAVISWTMADGVLTISEEWDEDWTNWRNWVHFDGDDLKVHLVLPQEAAEELTLSVSADYGDLDFDGVQAGALTAQAGAGEIDLESCRIGEVSAVLGAGEIKVEKSEISGLLSAESGSGDLKIEESTLGSADLTLAFGDIEIEGAMEGDLSAKTEAGDVRVRLSGQREAYSYELSTSFGDIRLNGTQYTGSHSEQNSGPLIRAETQFGDVQVTVGQ